MIKVMRFKQGRRYISKVRENQGSTEPFNWSIINVSILVFRLTLGMQGRFKMEYRLFSIVRYNYRDYKQYQQIIILILIGSIVDRHYNIISYEYEATED